MKNLVKHIAAEGEKGLTFFSLDRFLRISNNMERDATFLCNMKPKEQYQLITINELHDTIYMANLVGEKVNFTWSPIRWKQEHDRLSATILEAKIKLGFFGTEVEIKQHKDLLLAIQEQLPENYTVLKTNLDYFHEAKEMKHCLHTYIEQAMKGEYITISTTAEGQRYTCGLRKLPGKKFWKIDQIRGNKNCSPSEKVYSEIVENLSARLKTVESIEVVR